MINTHKIRIICWATFLGILFAVFAGKRAVIHPSDIIIGFCFGSLVGIFIGVIMNKLTSRKKTF